MTNEDIFNRGPDPKPEPGRMVVADDGGFGDGLILWHDGEDVRREIGETSRNLEDKDIEVAPGPGIWVWEGVIKYKSWRSYEGDYDCEVTWIGTFRAPTDDEWRSIRLGLSPWPAPLDTDEGPIREPLTDITGCDV